MIEKRNTFLQFVTHRRAQSDAYLPDIFGWSKHTKQSSASVHHSQSVRIVRYYTNMNSVDFKANNKQKTLLHY